MPRHTRLTRIRFVPLLALAFAACGDSDSALGLDEAFLAGGMANATSCRGVLGSESVEKIYVPRGQTCTLDGTRVRGNVLVAAGASFTSNGARIEGNVQAEDALLVALLDDTFVGGDVQVKRRAAVRVESTTIIGDLQIEERGTSLVASDNTIGGNLQVKKAASADITRTEIDGDLQLEENSGALSTSDSGVRGNLQVVKNSGGVTLEDNRVSQALQCKENSPAPVGGGNVAGEKEEQCSAL